MDVEGAFAHDVEVEVVARGGALLDHAVARAEAARYWGDLGEMQGRHREAWGRYWGDIGEIWVGYGIMQSPALKL